MTASGPFNLMQWIGENRELLQPPVGNARILPEGDFIVMAIGGPNQRTDYHDDAGLRKCGACGHDNPGRPGA